MPKLFDSIDSSDSASYSWSFWLYVIGMGILVLSILWVLVKSPMLSPDEIYYQSLLQLFAVCLLIGAWWTRSAEEDELCPEMAVEKPMMFKPKKATGGPSTSFWDKWVGGSKRKVAGKPGGKAGGKTSFKPPRAEPEETAHQEAQEAQEAQAAAQIEKLLNKDAFRAPSNSRY
jgi:hypothetical protein